MKALLTANTILWAMLATASVCLVGNRGDLAAQWLCGVTAKATLVNGFCLFMFISEE